jgi:D-alanine-D-alanine ligase
MKDKKKIFVLMGGRSPEHEISLISGKEVVRNLDYNKFEVLPVIISRDSGTWKLVSPNNLLNAENPLDLKGTHKELQVRDAKSIPSLRSVETVVKPIVFIAMHGPFGEDGTIQGMLELSGLNYTGSGVLASALGMDKIMFRKVLGKENVPLPKYLVLNKGEKLVNIQKKIGKYPYFIKPSNQGSSVGSSIARNRRELQKAVTNAFKYSKSILIDEYLKGKEVTCGLLGNNDPLALPIIEIVPKKGDFFDYKSKYYEGGAEEIVPARISKTLTNKIQDISIKVHKILGCRGFSRVDFIIKDNKYPIVLETNTIPGLTPMSLLPKAAKAAGISYEKLLEKIIKYAEE